MPYRVSIRETRTQTVFYDVEAQCQEEAIEKALIGDTINKTDGNGSDLDILTRNFVNRPENVSLISAN